MKELKRECLIKHISYDPITGVFVRVKNNKEIVSVDSNGYICTKVLGSTYKAHRLAFLYTYGAMPKGHVDHINGIVSDNRMVNLRDVTQKENNKNAKLRKDNSTGVSGVHFHKITNMFESYISDGGVQVRLGSFDCFFEAVCARKSAERKYCFHYNHGRSS